MTTRHFFVAACGPRSSFERSALSPRPPSPFESPALSIPRCFARLGTNSVEGLRANGLVAIAGLVSLLIAVPAAAQVSTSSQVAREVAREVSRAVSRGVSREVARDASRDVSRGVSREIARQVQKSVRGIRVPLDQERQGPQQTEKITKSFKVGKAGALDLSNFSGDVTVTGGPGDEINLEAVKQVRARTPEDAKASLEAIRVNITERGGRVEVRTDYARHDIRGGVDYTIAVPTGASVTVKTIAGDVKVTGVKGELRAESLSGDVTVAGGGETVWAKTLSGDVTVSDVTGGGETTISSISGTITARNVKARNLELNTTSGDLVLIDVTSSRATCATMSGDVDYTGPLAKGGRYEFRSHSGDVRIVPTVTTGFEVDASTFSGTFRSDFPVTLRSVGPATPTPPPPPPPPTPPTRPGERTTGTRAAERAAERRIHTGPPTRSVQGTYGDGSSVLMLVSFSGDITIVKK